MKAAVQYWEGREKVKAKTDEHRLTAACSLQAGPWNGVSKVSLSWSTVGLWYCKGK